MYKLNFYNPDKTHNVLCIQVSRHMQTIRFQIWYKPPILKNIIGVQFHFKNYDIANWHVTILITTYIIIIMQDLQRFILLLLISRNIKKRISKISITMHAIVNVIESLQQRNYINVKAIQINALKAQIIATIFLLMASTIPLYWFSANLLASSRVNRFLKILSDFFAGFSDCELYFLLFFFPFLSSISRILGRLFWYKWSYQL